MVDKNNNVIGFRFTKLININQGHGTLVDKKFYSNKLSLEEKYNSAIKCYNKL